MARQPGSGFSAASYHRTDAAAVYDNPVTQTTRPRRILSESRMATLRAGDCVSDVDLWPRVDSTDIHEFLVRRTSFITREQLKSRKALEGHNFVTSGWVREPWVKKAAAYTVIVVTQVMQLTKSNIPCRHGHIKAAACSIRKALEINPNFTAARQSLDGLRTLLVERWHFRMLNDISRNEAFHDAITAAVQKGHKRVLDIGAGTGLLSLFALSAGAHKVYSCEVSSTSCEVARTVFDENDFGTKACIINKHSTELTIPGDLDERVTLVVTETFDAGLFGEHVLKSLDHAWEHLLSGEPSVSGEVVQGILKLENVELKAACDDDQPYDSEKLSHVKHGFQRLSEPFHLLSVDFNNHQEIKNLIKGIHWREKVCCTQSGTLDAVCLWFRLKVGDAWLDTGPESNSCWEQAVFTDSLEELYHNRQIQYDVFIVNVFESSGLLRQGVFEDIALLRKSCLKSDVTMIPSSLTLRALLIESEALEEQSRLVSNSRTLDFRIADSINAFQVQMQQDICLATLPHRPLSDVFTLLEINMSNVGLDLPEISAIRSVPLLQTGRITGCCYWFEQECFGGITVSSYSVEDASLQAAVVFSSGVHGNAGATGASMPAPACNETPLVLAKREKEEDSVDDVPRDAFSRAHAQRRRRLASLPCGPRSSSSISTPWNTAPKPPGLLMPPRASGVLACSVLGIPLWPLVVLAGLVTGASCHQEHRSGGRQRKFISYYGHREVQEGENFIIYCFADPKAKISWTKDGSPLRHWSAWQGYSVSEYNVQDFKVSRLEVQAADADFSGSYSCSSESPAKHFVQVTDLQDSNGAQADCHVLVPNESLRLRCGIAAPDGENLTWFKDEEELFPDNDRFLAIGRTLEIRRTSEDDAGVYSCSRGRSAMNDSAGVVHVLQLVTPVRLEPLESAVSAPLGARVNLECRAYARPDPQITWLFG
ncbi:hypothetical protein HPB50_025829 [Hyalomma asiaticum]|uniref:Uncharacterized protein n=1 Tax=Hyalomma asiaticum TaxID=266040 RepID=A0ACB7SQP5_HYAAI|nr:hypothetical protein HPB50_025829 [Hyalomma asiaticum]